MLAMRHQKLFIVMAPQRQEQRRPRVGVLHAALLLLCLALLMRASASVSARPVPSDNGNGNGCTSDLATCNQSDEGGVRSQEVSHMEKSILPQNEADEDSMNDCVSVTDSTNESCAEDINRRFLDADYGSPGRNQDNHPGGPP